jgi:hypothetical protein
MLCAHPTERRAGAPRPRRSCGAHPTRRYRLRAHVNEEQVPAVPERKHARKITAARWLTHDACLAEFKEQEAARVAKEARRGKPRARAPARARGRATAVGRGGGQGRGRGRGGGAAPLVSCRTRRATATATMSATPTRARTTCQSRCQDWPSDARTHGMRAVPRRVGGLPLVLLVHVVRATTCSATPTSSIPSSACGRRRARSGRHHRPEGALVHAVCLADAIRVLEGRQVDDAHASLRRTIHNRGQPPASHAGFEVHARCRRLPFNL